MLIRLRVAGDKLREQAISTKETHMIKSRNENFFRIICNLPQHGERKTPENRWKSLNIPE